MDKTSPKTSLLHAFQDSPAPNTQKFLSRWLFSTNHKDIGILYFLFRIFAGVIGTLYEILALFHIKSSQKPIYGVFFLTFCNSPAIPIIEKIFEGTQDIQFFLILVFFIVLWVLLRAVYLVEDNKNMTAHFYFIPTTVLVLVALPSYVFLYRINELELHVEQRTFRLIEGKWYSNFEYSDYTFKRPNSSLKLEDYILLEKALAQGQLKLLNPGDWALIPEKTSIRILGASRDCLHLSSGAQLTPYPGSLNQYSLFTARPRIVYIKSQSEGFDTDNLFSEILESGVFQDLVMSINKNNYNDSGTYFMGKNFSEEKSEDNTDEEIAAQNKKAAMRYKAAAQAEKLKRSALVPLTTATGTHPTVPVVPVRDMVYGTWADMPVSVSQQALPSTSTSSVRNSSEEKLSSGYTKENPYIRKPELPLSAVSSDSWIVPQASSRNRPLQYTVELGWQTVIYKPRIPQDWTKHLNPNVPGFVFSTYGNRISLPYNQDLHLALVNYKPANPAWGLIIQIRPFELSDYAMEILKNILFWDILYRPGENISNMRDSDMLKRWMTAPAAFVPHNQGARNIPAFKFSDYQLTIMKNLFFWDLLDNPGADTSNRWSPAINRAHCDAAAIRRAVGQYAWRPPVEKKTADVETNTESVSVVNVGTNTPDPKILNFVELELLRAENKALKAENQRLGNLTGSSVLSSSTPQNFVYAADFQTTVYTPRTSFQNATNYLTTSSTTTPPNAALKTASAPRPLSGLNYSIGTRSSLGLNFSAASTVPDTWNPPVGMSEEDVKAWTKLSRDRRKFFEAMSLDERKFWRALTPEQQKIWEKLDSHNRKIWEGLTPELRGYWERMSPLHRRLCEELRPDAAVIWMHKEPYQRDIDLDPKFGDPEIRWARKLKSFFLEYATPEDKEAWHNVGEQKYKRVWEQLNRDYQKFWEQLSTAQRDILMDSEPALKNSWSWEAWKECVERKDFKAARSQFIKNMDALEKCLEEDTLMASKSEFKKFLDAGKIKNNFREIISRSYD